MIRNLADELAKAAAEREKKKNRRKRPNDDDEQQQRPSTPTPRRQSPRASPKGSPVSILKQQEQPPQKPQRFPTLPLTPPPSAKPKPRGIEDPPGWNSSWKPHSMDYMQQQIRQAQQQQQQQRNRLDHHQVDDDDGSSVDSFQVPLSSWVPQIDKDQRHDHRLSTTWTSHATQTTLKEAVPTKSWNVKLDGKHPSEKNSWAPHLHPGGPQALSPYPPGYTTPVVPDDDQSDDDDDEEEEEEVTEESETIEVIDDDVTSTTTSYNDQNRPRRHSSTTVPPSRENGSVSSESTNQVFAEARAKGVLKTGPPPPSTGVGPTNSTSGSTDHTRTNSNPGSSKSPWSSSSPSTSSPVDVEEGGPEIFVVDPGDDFLVFDEDWRFTPSRGTLSVLALCIVLALEGIAIGLYFAFR